MITNELFTPPCSRESGSQRGSGLRRIVCLAALLVCFFANVQAQVKIGDISLTSGSFSSVSVGFEGIITSGYVNYNESGNVLRLYEASIKAGLDINKEGLTIQLIGDCSIQTTANGVYLRSNISVTTPEGAGSLTITSSGGTGLYIGQYTLTVSGIAVVSAEGKEYGIRGGLSSCGKLAMSDKATLKAKGSTMGSVRYMDLSDGPQTYGFTITNPKGAKYVDSRKGIVGADDNMVSNEWVIFEKAIAIDATNFPDENFCNWLLEQDYGSDGYLGMAEIADVTEIDVSNKGIVNLTGIEYFTALQYLECQNNNLTSLDLSRNSRLLAVACWGNQIRGADMNALVNSLHTSYLDEHWSEYIQPRLIVVHSGGFQAYNWMTAIQVGAANEKGWLVQNSINENYRGEDPGVAINKTNFPDANFRAYVSGEDIDQDGDGYLNEMEVWWVTEINVSNQNISDLKGIEFFNGLKELDCSYNQLTSLKVSHNYALTRLYCYCNRIRGTDMTKLVNSLPDRKSASEEGTLWVYYIDDSPAGNMMTPGQVEIAREKNWNVVMWDDDYEDFIPYEGETPDGIEISEENFPDEVFLAYVSDNCDSDEDGYLSDEEIADVTEIEVNDKGIASLKGIEYFTELACLICFGNQLTELDVTNNTALVTMDCADNQLTELDVSKNTELRYLYCNNNQLTKLDVSEKEDLTDLYCNDNQLTELDVSKSTKLWKLYCNNNLLTELDVSKNTELWELYCYDNRLTALNVTGCEVLYYLHCYGNGIRGDAMTALVGSLKDHSAMMDEYGPAQLYVYKDETPTGNMMTPQQVQTAKDKGWDVLVYKDYDWVDYEGENIGELLPGDANGDGEVNAEDLEAVRDYILGLDPSPFYLEGADLKVDGVVDIVDLTKLIEMLK